MEGSCLVFFTLHHIFHFVFFKNSDWDFAGTPWEKQLISAIELIYIKGVQFKSIIFVFASSK